MEQVLQEFRIARGCEFPQCPGWLKISRDGTEELFNVSETKDILRVLCEVAARNPNIEQLVSQHDEFNFIEHLESIEEEDRQRGFAFPKENPRWFVDYKFLIKKGLTHGACYLVTERLLEGSEAVFFDDGVGINGREDDLNNNNLAEVGTKSSLTVNVTEPTETPANNSIMTQGLPAPSQEDTLLGKLDRAVYEHVKNGESALQIALTDNLVNCEMSWSQQALNDLRTAIQDLQQQEIKQVLSRYQYAVKILWFRTVALADAFDGSNHVAPFRNAVLMNNVDLYNALRNLDGYIRCNNAIPSFPFDVEETPFSVYVWFPCGTGGATSRLVWGLKKVVENCRVEGEEYGLDPDSYHDDNRLSHIEKLLRYDQNDLWHRGGDFVGFVRWIAERNGEDAGPAPEAWVDRIWMSPNCEALLSEDRIFARVGVYLRWHMPQNMFSHSSVKQVIGVDRIAKCESIRYSFDGEREWQTPLRNYSTIEFDSNRREFAYTLQGQGQSRSVSLNVNSVCGLYARVVDSSADIRSSWWKRIGCGLADDTNQTYDEHLSSFTHSVIAVCECENNDAIPDGFELSGNWTIQLNEKEYHLYLLHVGERGMVDRLVHLYGFDVIVSAATPCIELSRDTGLCTWGNRQIPICASNSEFMLDNVTTQCEATWYAGDAPLGNGISATLCNAKLGQVCKVSAVIRGGSKKSKAYFVLPPTVIDSLVYGREADVDEWRVERCHMDVADAVESARNGLEIWRVLRDGVECVKVARPATGLVWWVEDSEHRIQAENLCQRVSINEAVELCDRYIAFPECVYSEGLVHLFAKTTEGDLVGTAGPEFGDGQVRFCLSALVNVDHDRATRAFRYSDNGYRGERGCLRFHGRDVCEYPFQPSTASLVKDEIGRIGIYAPQGTGRNYEVVVFTDNLDAPFYDGEKTIFVEIPEDRCFAEISQDFINEVSRLDANGQIFLGLQRDEWASLCSSYFDYIDEAKYSIMLLREPIGNYPLPLQMVRSVRPRLTVCNGRLNPVWKEQSRLYRLCEQYSDCHWWFADNANLQMPRTCLNGSEDFYNLGECLDSICFCRPPHALTFLSEAQENLCFEGPGGCRALFLRDLILSSKERNECNFDAVGGDVNGGWLSARLRTCDESAGGVVICNVDLSAGRPLLCRKGDSWGVYFPNEWNGRQVLLVAYSDCAELPSVGVAREKLTGVECGFLSISDFVDRACRENPCAEVHVAVFWDFSQDYDFGLLQACDLRKAQIVKVACSSGLYLPTQEQRADIESLRHDDNIRNHPTLSSSRMLVCEPMDVGAIIDGWMNFQRTVNGQDDARPQPTTDGVAKLIVNSMQGGRNVLLENFMFRSLRGVHELPDDIRNIFVDRDAGQNEGAGLCSAMCALCSIERGVAGGVREQQFDMQTDFDQLGICGVFSDGIRENRRRLIGIDIMHDGTRRVRLKFEQGVSYTERNNECGLSLLKLFDEREFIESRLNLFRRWLNEGRERWWDLSTSDRILLKAQRENVNSAFEQITTYRQGARLTRFSCEMLRSWAGAFPREESWLGKMLVRTALACAAHLTRTLARNNVDGFQAGTTSYIAISQVTYWAFNQMLNGNKEPWRLIMWVLTSALGLLHFVNRPELEQQ